MQHFLGIYGVRVSRQCPRSAASMVNLWYLARTKNYLLLVTVIFHVMANLRHEQF